MTRRRNSDILGGSMNAKLKKPTEKTDLILLRLKKIEGQICAIKRMYEEKTDCDKIIQQIIAAREALGGAAKIILKDQAVTCIRKPLKVDNLEKTLSNLIKFT